MTVRHCPALLVAAPASGQGKTTLTAGLARLHARAGRQVRVFKCGPDFIDPQWLALASGHAVHNVDLWLCGEEDVCHRLWEAAGEADIILIEGVMGLFDGDPSAADLAQRLGIPVMAVIDASAMAGTFGALVHGLRHYRAGLPWAGVLANRVASDGHADMLAQALPESADWLGGVRRQANLQVGERHLGLHLAMERKDGLAVLDAVADALAHTPLGQMSMDEWQRWAVPFWPVEIPQVPRLLQGKTIALAHDEAFAFVYAANVQTLEALGAKVLRFSPLANEPVPAEADALWLPGGYPELHAGRLQANATSAASVLDFLTAGKPVWAECGGWMVLCETLTDAQGNRFPMWGAFPGQVQMQARLVALGPQAWDGEHGRLRGHAFHYSSISTALEPVAQTLSVRGGATRAGEAVHRHGSLQASYFHPWFASNPLAVAQLFLPADQGSAAAPGNGCNAMTFEGSH